MKNPTIAFVALAIASIATLSGCSFNANLTVPASSIATTTTKALLTATDYDFDVDCGSDNVDLVNGTKVQCTATDPANDREYDVISTINGVDGTKYTVNADMKGEPAGATDEQIDESGSSGTAATTTRNYIANLTATTLQEKVGGQLPLVNCGDGAQEIDVVEDFVVFCELTDANASAIYDTTVTMKDVVGDNFTIDIQVSDTPLG